MKYLFIFLSFCLSFFAHTSDYHCIEDFLDKKIVFAFNDGDIHSLEFKKNTYDIVTANYYSSGNKKFRDIPVYCLDASKEIFLQQKKSSPVGPFRYDLEIYIPYVITSGESAGKVDLRWGRFYTPYPKLYVREL